MKKIQSGILPVLLALGLTVGVPTGWASAATSNANVIFTPGVGPVSPVDPDEPSLPGPGDPVNGPLAIVSITDFDFGEVVLGLGALEKVVETERPNIQTVDLRGVNSGWHVTAQLGQFTDFEEEPSLLGASITITGGNAISEYTLAAPVHAPPVMLTAGSSQPTQVISAAKDAGIGLWVMRWYPEGGGTPYIHLDIPAGRAAVGAHTAVILWTLTDGP